MFDWWCCSLYYDFFFFFRFHRSPSAGVLFLETHAFMWAWTFVITLTVTPDDFHDDIAMCSHICVRSPTSSLPPKRVRVSLTKTNSNFELHRCVEGVLCMEVKYSNFHHHHAQGALAIFKSPVVHLLMFHLLAFFVFLVFLSRERSGHVSRPRRK